MKPGNKKGTNSSPPDRTGRIRRTTIVLRTPSHVLNGTAGHCGPPFGTKKPQVQILSPRPCFRREEARTRNGAGLFAASTAANSPSTATTTRFDLSVGGLHLACSALRARRRGRGRKSVASTRVPAGHPPEVGVSWLPVNTRRTAHSGEVGSRLLAAVSAEMTSSKGGTPDNPAGVA